MDGRLSRAVVSKVPEPFGWIDSRTVAGSLEPAGTVAYVSLDSPGHAVDLGFKGWFVGGLAA